MDHREQWMMLFMKIGFERIKMLSHSNFNILKTLMIKSNVDQISNLITNLSTLITLDFKIKFIILYTD